MRYFLLTLFLVACGHKDTTEGHFGYQCFGDEQGDIQCDAKPGDLGLEIRCDTLNKYWNDYFAWQKTGDLCVGPRS